MQDDGRHGSNRCKQVAVFHVRNLCPTSTGEGLALFGLLHLHAFIFFLEKLHAFMFTLLLSKPSIVSRPTTLLVLQCSTVLVADHPTNRLVVYQQPDRIVALHKWNQMSSIPRRTQLTCDSLPAQVGSKWNQH